MAIDIYPKNDTGDWLILSYRASDRLELTSMELLERVAIAIIENPYSFPK